MEMRSQSTSGIPSGLSSSSSAGAAMMTPLQKNAMQLPYNAGTVCLRRPLFYKRLYYTKLVKRYKKIVDDEGC